MFLSCEHQIRLCKIEDPFVGRPFRCYLGVGYSPLVSILQRVPQPVRCYPPDPFLGRRSSQLVLPHDSLLCTRGAKLLGLNRMWSAAHELSRPEDDDVKVLAKKNFHLMNIESPRPQKLFVLLTWSRPSRSSFSVMRSMTISSGSLCQPKKSHAWRWGKNDVPSSRYRGFVYRPRQTMANLIFSSTLPLIPVLLLNLSLVSLNGSPGLRTNLNGTPWGFVGSLSK